MHFSFFPVLINDFPPIFLSWVFSSFIFILSYLLITEIAYFLLSMDLAIFHVCWFVVLPMYFNYVAVFSFHILFDLGVLNIYVIESLCVFTFVYVCVWSEDYICIVSAFWHLLRFCWPKYMVVFVTKMTHFMSVKKKSIIYVFKEYISGYDK